MNGTPPQAALADRQSETGAKIHAVFYPIPLPRKRAAVRDELPVNRNPSVRYSSALVFFLFWCFFHSGEGISKYPLV